MLKWSGPLEKVAEYRWRIPQSYKPGMRVPGLIYARRDGLIITSRQPEDLPDFCREIIAALSTK